MRRKLTGFSIVGGLILLAALFTLMGCSNNNPLGPEPSDNIGLNRGFVPGAPTSSDVTQDVSVIDAGDGGEIVINRNDYEHEFIVAPGSLDKDTEISVSSYKSIIHNKEALVFEFGPAGLVFKEASKLDVDMADVNPSASYAKLYYYNPSKKIWELQSFKAVVDGRIEFDICHFSKYAISD